MHCRWGFFSSSDRQISPSELFHFSEMHLKKKNASSSCATLLQSDGAVPSEDCIPIGCIDLSLAPLLSTALQSLWKVNKSENEASVPGDVVPQSWHHSRESALPAYPPLATLHTDSYETYESFLGACFTSSQFFQVSLTSLFRGQAFHRVNFCLPQGKIS